MRRVYLIRHGKPDFPGGEKMCLGITDLPLGEEGRIQARELAEVLPRVEAVFSSSLSRAADTARFLGKPVQVVPGLQELGAGQWDGLTFREIRREYPALYEARGTDPKVPIPGQEDPEKGLRRFRQALLEALNRSTGDIAVVTHGGVMTAFRESLGGGWEKPGYVQIIPLMYDGEFHLQEECL